MAEIPALNQLQSLFEGDERVQFLSFFKDTILEKNGEQLFQSRGFSSITQEKYQPVDFHFKHYGNCEQLNHAFNVRGFPNSLVIDQNGIIRHIIKGASMEEEANLTLVPKYEQMIQKLLGN